MAKTRATGTGGYFGTGRSYPTGSEEAKRRPDTGFQEEREQ